MNQTKLSRQQKAILGCMFTIQKNAVCRRVGLSWMQPDEQVVCMVKWLVRRLYTVTRNGSENPTRSESASFSRALTGLCKRELIILYGLHQKDRPWLKSKGVGLSREGVALGRQLVTEKKKRNLEKLLKNMSMRRFKAGTSLKDFEESMKLLTSISG